MNSELLNVERDEKLKEELLDVLQGFDQTIMTNERLDVDEKVFIIKQTKEEVLHLQQLAISVRNTANKLCGKEVRADKLYSILNIAQAISSYLWHWSIFQHKIIDRIEMTYGMTFNNRRIYSMYRRSSDGTVGYFLSAGSIKYVERVSMAIDGQFVPMDKEEFLRDWAVVQ